jgi:hypothetical protein
MLFVVTLVGLWLLCGSALCSFFGRYTERWGEGEAAAAVFDLVRIGLELLLFW